MSSTFYQNSSCLLPKNILKVWFSRRSMFEWFSCLLMIREASALFFFCLKVGAMNLKGHLICIIQYWWSPVLQYRKHWTVQLLQKESFPLDVNPTRTGSATESISEVKIVPPITWRAWHSSFAKQLFKDPKISIRLGVAAIDVGAHVVAQCDACNLHCPADKCFQCAEHVHLSEHVSAGWLASARNLQLFSNLNSPLLTFNTAASTLPSSSLPFGDKVDWALSPQSI